MFIIKWYSDKRYRDNQLFLLVKENELQLYVECIFKLFQNAEVTIESA